MNEWVRVHFSTPGNFQTKFGNVDFNRSAQKHPSTIMENVRPAFCGAAIYCREDCSLKLLESQRKIINFLFVVFFFLNRINLTT